MSLGGSGILKSGCCYPLTDITPNLGQHYSNPKPSSLKHLTYTLIGDV